jgi:hypothetical protein
MNKAGGYNQKGELHIGKVNGTEIDYTPSQRISYKYTFLNSDNRLDADTIEVIEFGAIETYNYRNLDLPCRIIGGNGRVYNVTGISRNERNNSMILNVTSKAL